MPLPTTPPPSHADTLENVVHLDCEGRVEKLTLVNRRIQLRAVKEAFGLSSVRINGRLEPTDDEGYTITKFNPQTTLAISGQPSTGDEAARCVAYGYAPHNTYPRYPSPGAVLFSLVCSSVEQEC